jgi:prefoldin alpha subunit
MKPEDQQRTFMEFQMIEQQLKKFQQQLGMVHQQEAELTILIENLENFKDVKPNSPAFAQIGPGIAVEATINDTKHVLVNAGSTTAVKKTIPEAQKMLVKQREDMKKASTAIEHEMKKLTERAQHIQQELQQNQ